MGTVGRRQLQAASRDQLTVRAAASTADPGLAAMDVESRRETVRWWATGLGLVPLFILITVFGYVAVGALGGVVASPFVDLPEASGDPILAGSLGLAAVLLAVGGPFYLAVCALLLAVLRRLSAKGWDGRRLRRAAVAGGFLVTAPLVIAAPIGILYGLTVPLPGAGAETQRRALVRTSAWAIGLLVALVPLSLVFPGLD